MNKKFRESFIDVCYSTYNYFGYESHNGLYYSEDEIACWKEAEETAWHEMQK